MYIVHTSYTCNVRSYYTYNNVHIQAIPVMYVAMIHIIMYIQDIPVMYAMIHIIMYIQAIPVIV